MFRRRRIATVASLIAASLIAACAHAPARVDDEQVAKLPPSARQPLVAQQQRIDVARSNLVRAEVARDDATKQRQAARRELGAADERARPAARARIAYADDFVRLEQARVDEAQAALRLARARVELAKGQALYEHGLGPVDRLRLLDEQLAAEDELAARRVEVAEHAGAVDGTRRAWAREQAEARAASPPAPAPTLPPPTPMPVPMTPPM